MKIIPYIVICFLLTLKTNANDFDDYFNQYNTHQSEVSKLNRDITVFELQAKAQDLKTKFQRSRLACQKIGGCGAKTLYTPPKSQTNATQSKDENKDKELVSFVNKPLPKISAINNNTVSFDNDSSIYQTGDSVYGVWVVQKITATTVELLNKNNNASNTLYFYWK